ncbi:hypothetical protein [Scytonema millei]|uniref:Uncharacterized protein n=1 Tax=Scytonema millei VB511283 TaxID=1245923 RepID=A0A9X5E830_9CYAN|nr:hypothetical protein [Scytonema millei]NHC36498.1 hypothetical protein [Scytonema millei VB511283]
MKEGSREQGAGSRGKRAEEQRGRGAEEQRGKSIQYPKSPHHTPHPTPHTLSTTSHQPLATDN